MTQSAHHSLVDSPGVAATAMPGAIRAVLPDGRRQHFQHGPIDLVIEAFGAAEEVARSYEQGWRRFETVLGELVGELGALRTQAPDTPAVSGAIALRMMSACSGYGAVFVTPMAAVAGAVADDILAAMIAGRTLDKAYVNNGGDIAIHLVDGQFFKAGMVALANTPMAEGIATIAADDAVGGIATSGWRGRSLSLGIADSVTVLAQDAATADIAATLIANEVDTQSPAVTRTRAGDLDPDSDLGDRLVTTAVGDLDLMDIEAALDAGQALARTLVDRGTITAASLTLQDRHRFAGRPVSPAISTTDRKAIAA